MFPTRCSGLEAGRELDQQLGEGGIHVPTPGAGWGACPLCRFLSLFLSVDVLVFFLFFCVVLSTCFFTCFVVCVCVFMFCVFMCLHVGVLKAQPSAVGAGRAAGGLAAVAEAFVLGSDLRPR